MGRKRIGVALGGAVSRGIAHIGVLQVLEREGIPIDIVTGTSAGALAGALYCAGIPPGKMRELLANLNWLQVASLVWPRQGFVSFRKLERWVTDAIGDCTFADLQRPFAAVATNLNTGQAVHLRAGRIAPAIHASCAVPGFVVPVPRGDMLLCDGGVTENTPVAAARELGADYVIGVDMFRPKIRKGWGPLGYGFAALEMMIQAAGGGMQQADCLISAEMAGMSYLRFGLSDKYIGLGVQATEGVLEKLRTALG